MEDGHVITIGNRGSVVPGSADGDTSKASFNMPTAIAMGYDGEIYICDRGNNTVRILEDGNVTLFAGTGAQGTFDASLNQAMFGSPIDLSISPDGSIFVADSYPARGRVIKEGSVVQTVFGGAPTKKREKQDFRQSLSGKTSPLDLKLGYLASCAVAPDGSVYFAQCDFIFRYSNDALIREYSGSELNIRKIAFDAAGNMYWTEAGSNRIKARKSGKVLTIAGKYMEKKVREGPAEKSRVGEPHAIAVAPNGTVFFSETTTNTIMMVHQGQVTTIAGDGTVGSRDGPARQANFNSPQGLALDVKKGLLYIADTMNHRLRVLNLKGIVDVYSLNAPLSPTAAVPVPVPRLAPSLRQAASKADQFCVFTVLATPDGKSYGPLKNPKTVAAGPEGELYVADETHLIRRIMNGKEDIVVGAEAVVEKLRGEAAQVWSKEIVQLAADGGALYFADNQRKVVRKLENGTVTIVAGGGKLKAHPSKGVEATSVELADIRGIAVGPGQKLYISNQRNMEGILIRVDRQGIATRYCKESSFPDPGALFVSSEDELYITNKIKPGGISKAKNGSAQGMLRLGDAAEGSIDGDALTVARTINPIGIARGPDGSLYFTERGSHKIRVLRAGKVMTFAGGAASGHKDGVPGFATFNQPTGLAFDFKRGVLYVADTGNNCVRAITLPSDMLQTQVDRRGSVYLGPAPSRPRPTDAMPPSPASSSSSSFAPQ